MKVAHDIHARPCLSPYAIAGLLLSLLFGFQFMMVNSVVSEFGLAFPSLLRPAEWMVCCVVFLFPVAVWLGTKYAVSDSRVTSSVLLRGKSISLDYVSGLRIETRTYDRLMRTCSVSFVSRYGRVLMRWQFVRLDRNIRSKLRRLSIVLGS